MESATRLEHFLSESEKKIRLFSYKVFHFTFVPNRRTVAIVHNFIDYFR